MVQDGKRQRNKRLKPKTNQSTHYIKNTLLQTKITLPYTHTHTTQALRGGEARRSSGWIYEDLRSSWREGWLGLEGRWQKAWSPGRPPDGRLSPFARPGCGLWIPAQLPNSDSDVLREQRHALECKYLLNLRSQPAPILMLI